MRSDEEATEELDEVDEEVVPGLIVGLECIFRGAEVAVAAAGSAMPFSAIRFCILSFSVFSKFISICNQNNNTSTTTTTTLIN